MSDQTRPFEDALHDRLAALEARAPGRDDPPRLATAPGRGRRRAITSATAAPILLVAVVATATAGAYVAVNTAQARPGIQNPGQPMAGAHMECLSPTDAARLLAAHGFTRVTWQVEAGDPTAAGGDTAKGATTTTQQSTPPAHGYVVPGSVLDDGSVIMVVDQRVGATAGGACPDLPMP